MGLWRYVKYVSRSIPLSLKLILVCALVLSGCSEAALQGASGIADSVGSAVTGFETAGSQARVNKAQVKLTLANAALVRNQVEDLELKRDQIATERPVVVAILRERSREEHDPFLDDIALWVSAGGDPNYAFHYLMDHESAREARMQHNTLVVPPETSQPRTSLPHARHEVARPSTANAQPVSQIAQSNNAGVADPNTPSVARTNTKTVKPKANAAQPNINTTQPVTASTSASAHPAATEVQP